MLLGINNRGNFTLCFADINNCGIGTIILFISLLQPIQFFFIFFFDFQKINGRTKNFEKYTPAAVPHGGAVPYGVKSLPS
jgi:hypothetical protein